MEVDKGLNEKVEQKYSYTKASNSSWQIMLQVFDTGRKKIDNTL